MRLTPEFIAKVIADQATRQAHGLSGPTPAAQVAFDFADAIQQADPSFDRNRFMKSCAPREVLVRKIEERVTPTEAHVIAFSNGLFLGQARTHVKSVGSAILYTRSEAVKIASVYDLGTYSIIPLRNFDLDAMREQVAKEMEGGR